MTNQRITDNDFNNIQNELDDMNGYQELYNNQGIQLFCKTIDGLEGNAGKRWKWFGRVPFDTDTVYLTISSFEEDRKEWDENILDYQVYELLKASKGELENFIFYQSAKWPWPMANRDWICIACDCVEKHKDGRKYVSYARQIDHQKDPKDSSLVRVHTYHWSVTLTPVIVNGEIHTDYRIISQFDPNGWVPEFIVSYGVYSLPKALENGMVKGCTRTKEKNLKIENAKINGLNWK